MFGSLASVFAADSKNQLTSMLCSGGSKEKNENAWVGGPESGKQMKPDASAIQWRSLLQFAADWCPMVRHTQATQLGIALSDKRTFLCFWSFPLL